MSKVVVETGLNRTGFTTGLQALKGEVGKFQTNFSKDITRTIGGTIAGVFAVSSVVNFFSSAISEAKKYESTLKTFEPILGSTNAALERMRNLTDFAATTPFELDELAQASRTLETLTDGALATGDGLTLVGDTVAAVNGDFGELSVTIGRVYAGLQSGSKTIGAELNRLVELGIISIDTKNKLNEMQAAGVKGADAWGVVAGELGRFKGAMEGLSETLDGRLSTLQDTIASFKRTLAEAFIEPLKQGVSQISGMIEGMQELSRVGKEQGKWTQAKLLLGAVGETMGINNSWGQDAGPNRNRLNMDQMDADYKKALANNKAKREAAKAAIEERKRAEAAAASDRRQQQVKELQESLAVEERAGSLKQMKPLDRKRDLMGEQDKLTNEYAGSEDEARREEIGKRLVALKKEILATDQQIGQERVKLAAEEQKSAERAAEEKARAAEKQARQQSDLEYETAMTEAMKLRLPLEKIEGHLTEKQIEARKVELIQRESAARQIEIAAGYNRELAELQHDIDAALESGDQTLAATLVKQKDQLTTQKALTLEKEKAAAADERALALAEQQAERQRELSEKTRAFNEGNLALQGRNAQGGANALASGLYDDFLRQQLKQQNPITPGDIASAIGGGLGDNEQAFRLAQKQRLAMEQGKNLTFADQAQIDRLRRQGQGTQQNASAAFAAQIGPPASAAGSIQAFLAAQQKSGSAENGLKMANELGAIRGTLEMIQRQGQLS